MIDAQTFEAAQKKFSYIKENDNYTKGSGNHKLACTVYRVHFESKKTECEYSCEVVKNVFADNSVFYSLTNQGFNETEYIGCSPAQIKGLINTLAK